MSFRVPVSVLGGHSWHCLIAGLAVMLVGLSPSQSHANEPPAIPSFSIEYLGGGWWELFGFVSDEEPDFCEVYFTGLLEGYSVDVSSNGEFALIVSLPMESYGVVEAYALDPEYEWSAAASDYLDSSN